MHVDWYGVAAAAAVGLGLGIMVQSIASAQGAPVSATLPPTAAVDSTATDPAKFSGTGANAARAITQADRDAARQGIGANGKATGAANGAVNPR